MLVLIVIFPKYIPLHAQASDTALVSGGKRGSESKTRPPEFLSSEVGNPNCGESLDCDVLGSYTAQLTTIHLPGRTNVIYKWQ